MLTLDVIDTAEEYEQNMVNFLKGSTGGQSVPIKYEMEESSKQPSYQEIRIDQSPTQFQWGLIPLYKIGVSGDLMYWQIRFDGVKYLEISQGYNNGIIRTDKSEVRIEDIMKPLQERAFREARYLYKLKHREGYRPAGDITPPLITGMKGYIYKETSIKNWPVYTQPKLHGIRMLSQNNNERRLSLRSWFNNPFFHLKHIEDELQEFFEYLPQNSTLDGELYNHDLRFSTLTSIVKTVKEIHPNLQQIQYWIFDIDYQDPDGTPYERRYELLVNAFRRYLQDRSPLDDPNDISVLPKTFRVVPVQLARNHSEIVQQHKQHVSNGFEGIMIKKISNGYSPDTKNYQESLYKSNKCNHILKYKRFQDEEVIVVEIANSGLTVQDKRGYRYNIQMRGGIDLRWHRNPELILGKEITIRYQDLNADGIPLYPIGIGIRDYE